jgi:transposase-like protein
MSRNRLAFYPFVIVRVSCRHCTRRRSYRLARLGTKYGPEIELDDLLRELAGILRLEKLLETATNMVSKRLKNMLEGVATMLKCVADTISQIVTTCAA